MAVSALFTVRDSTLMFEPLAAPEDMVPCPVCQKKMKAWQVFQHLEACPGPATNTHSASSGPGAAVSGTAASGTAVPGQLRRRPERPLERLPALNYSMLKDNALRKKMRELGLSINGPRRSLEKRHREWLTLWNANCDSSHPKSRHELLREFDFCNHANRAPVASTTDPAATKIKDKDFDGAAWAVKHDASFKDLVASARKSRAETNVTRKDGDAPERAGSLTEMVGEGSETRKASEASVPKPAADMPSGHLGDSPLPHPDLESSGTTGIGGIITNAAASMEGAEMPDLLVAEDTATSADTCRSMKELGKDQKAGNQSVGEIARPPRPLE